MNDTTPVPSASGLKANDLGVHWMPFTANRQFKQCPAPVRRAPKACTT